MNWLVIIPIVFQVLKLIIGSRIHSSSEKLAMIEKLRQARIKAVQTGDTSDLESLKSSLLS